MNLKMEVQILSRGFFEIFKVKKKETVNLLNILQLRAEREKAQFAVLEDFSAKCVPIFEEGKTISSYMKVFNAPLKEEISEAIEHRSQVYSGFTAEDNPIYLLQQWIDKNGDEGHALFKLAKKTIKKYEAIVAQVQTERKNIQKKLEELDLNLTCQGKYGGSHGNKKESTAAKKRRIQFEFEEDRLRCSIEKCFDTYQALISEEIASRCHFLKTMSAIRDQSSVLEARRLNVVAEAYNRYISLIESAEPLSPRRELVLHQMRNIASGMVEVHTNMFKQWTKEKTRNYTFELFTDNWTNYGLGIVTNDVPGMVIPANLQVVSGSDKTGSSPEEKSGHSLEETVTSEPCHDSHLANVSDQSDQEPKPGSQQPEPSGRDKQLPCLTEAKNKDDFGHEEAAHDKAAVVKVNRKPVPMVKVQTIPPDENVATPAKIRSKTNGKQVGPNLKSLNPPPKSSTDGWRATQTPLESLTLPVKTNDQANRSSVAKAEDLSTGNESPVDDTNTRSAAESSSQTDVEPHLRMQIFTGTDHPYYTPGDPEDLITYLLPEGKTERPQAPFKPMINNWMEPEVETQEAKSSDHSLLPKFLNRSKRKKSKKASKSKNPEMVDSGPVPFDFGCENVEEISKVIDADERKSRGSRALPTTPGPSHVMEKPKTVAPSGSGSSDNGNGEAREARCHSVRVIKLCSIDSYQAKNVEEISFVSGQTVKMIHPPNAEGMAYGYTRSSRVKKREFGYFPASHVVRVIEDQNKPISRKVSGFFKKR